MARRGRTADGADGTEHVRLHVDGRDVGPLEVARTRRARGRGLLGRDGVDGAIWLSPATQVHTVAMRFTIDVAHVARDGRVLAVTTMRPQRLGALRLRARGVLEADAGAFERWGLAVGSVVSWDGGPA